METFRSVSGVRLGGGAESSPRSTLSVTVEISQANALPSAHTAVANVLLRPGLFRLVCSVGLECGTP
jgi:hypothetical protein